MTDASPRARLSGALYLYIVPVVAETAFRLWRLIRWVDAGRWRALLQECRTG